MSRNIEIAVLDRHFWYPCSDPGTKSLILSLLQHRYSPFSFVVCSSLGTEERWIRRVVPISQWTLVSRFLIVAIVTEREQKMSLNWDDFQPEHKETKIFEKHLNPIMLVFIGKLSLSTLRWVWICQSFSHFSGSLHYLVLAKFTTSSIRVNWYLPHIQRRVVTSVD